MNVHKRLIICLITFSFLFNISGAYAQWEQVKSINGGTINDLLKIGNSIFAATNGGVFRSTDAGSSWTKTSSFGEVKKLRNYRSGILALSEGDLYHSIDNGTNWDTLASGYGVNEIEVFNDELYMISSDENSSTFTGYLFKSVDGGETFQKLMGSTIIFDFWSTRILRQIDNKLFVLSSEKLLYTTNGTNFSGISLDGLPSRFVFIALEGFSLNNLYIVPYDFLSLSLYKYNGSVWQKVLMQTGDAYYTYGLCRYGDSLYAHITETLPPYADEMRYISKINSLAWSSIPSGDLPGHSFKALVKANSSKYLFATDNGVFSSSNPVLSVTHNTSSNGMYATSHKCILACGDTLLISSHDGKLLHSFDDGNNWQAIATGLPVNGELVELGQMKGGIYAIINSSQWHDLYLSYDRGKSWTKATSYFDDKSTFDENSFKGFAGSMTIYETDEGTGSNFHLSVDGGKTFTDITNNLPDDLDVVGRIMGTEDTAVVFGYEMENGGYSNSSYRLYMTYDKGDTWENIKTFETPYQTWISGLSYTEGKFYLVFNEWGFSVNSYLYELNGNQWVQKAAVPILNIHNLHKPAQIQVKGKNIYLSDKDNIYYKEQDALEKWTPCMDGLPGGLVLNDFLITDKYCFLTTDGNGIFNRVNISSGIENNIVENHFLALYPNPATAHVNMKWDNSSGKTPIIIEFFDINGHLVKQEQVKADGELSFSVADLNSGVYNCVIRSANGFSSRKLVVIK